MGGGGTGNVHGYLSILRREGGREGRERDGGGSRMKEGRREGGGGREGSGRHTIVSLKGEAVLRTLVFKRDIYFYLFSSCNVSPQITARTRSAFIFYRLTVV